MIQEDKREIERCIQNQDISHMEEIIASLSQETKESMILSCLIGIHRDEIRHQEEYPVFLRIGTVDEAVEEFVWVKLLLRRLEFDLPKEYAEEIYHYVEENHVSVTYLAAIVKVNIFRQKNVCEKLSILYEGKEGAQSRKARIFRELSHTFPDKKEQ